MIDWYLRVKNLIGIMDDKARHASQLLSEGNLVSAATIQSYLKSDYQQLTDL